MKQSRLMLFGVALVLAIPLVAQEAAEGTAKPSETASVAARPRKMSLNLPVLTVRNRLSGKQVGRCSFLPMTVSVSGDKSPLRISFSDDTPNGSGATIRNSLWTAALVAALQKESALQGVRISLDFRGGVDGPSAGAVMCLGILSALDGRNFPDDFAMTGAILPDGTVGLVGGVPEKLKAVSKNPKIKRVAIPAFQRFAKDNDGEWVDLFALGKGLGLELCPVESVGDAYNFLHGEKPSQSVIPTALSMIRESAAFEANAVEIFKARDVALKERLNSLSSNDFQTVTQGFEWGSINPKEAERRFEEGAIFDALDLISRSDSSLTAALQSWKFYLDYRERFLDQADGKRKLFKKSLRDTKMHEWPIDVQLAYIDDFRKEIAEFCETALGWKKSDEGSDGNSESDESWFGFVPDEGSSDLMQQLLSFVESSKSEGHYRYMLRQTFDRTELKKALQEGDRDIYAEIDYDRKKLYFLFSEKLRTPSFQGVSIPALNAGHEVSSALELFRKAWQIADGAIESGVVDSYAENASVHKNAVNDFLIGRDHLFAVYDAAKRWGNVALALYEDAASEANPFGYPSYTDSALLFICADLFAEASAQRLSLERNTENASFTAFVTERARASALMGMDACQKAGIPCLASLLAFQRAERARADSSEVTSQILADYWKATMSAKALLMAFKNGKGEKDGFRGYPLSEESAMAVESESALLRVLFNADIAPAINSLPEQWLKNLGDAAAVAAKRIDDEEWELLREVVSQAGDLLVAKSEMIAEMSATNICEGLDAKVVQGVVENWGLKLGALSRSAKHEIVAAGGIAEVLRAKNNSQNSARNTGREFPMPKIVAQMKSRSAVDVSIPDWSIISSALDEFFGSDPDRFVKVDGKMVLADLVPWFKDSGSFRAIVDEAMNALTKNEIHTMLLSVSSALREAQDSTDIESLGAAFSKITALFDAGNASEGDDKSIQSESAAQDDDFDADYDLDD